MNLSLEQNVKIHIKEDWATSNIQVDVSGRDFEEIKIMRKHILNGFEAIKKYKDSKNSI